MKPLNVLATGMLAAAALLSFGQVSAMADDMRGDALDYSQLYNNTYDFADLMQAKALDASDDLIARMLKLARFSHCTFQEIAHQSADGLSIAVIAEKHGVPYAWLDNVDKEKDEIAAYIAAYQATGLQSVRRQTLQKNEDIAARRGRK